MTVPLISGSTGFLGSALLRQMPAAHLLLRGGDAAARAARLARRSGGSFHAIPGDVEEGAWGLQDATLTGLRSEVSVVVNLAAVTDWSAPTARLQATNVAGAVHGAEVAARLGVPYVHVSSLYAAYRVEGEVREELVPESGRLSRYERSKCRAEWRVARRCRQLGVPCTIARVGGLAGDHRPTPGHRARRDRVPFAWLLTTRGFGFLPYARGARVDVSPRDLVAERLGALIDHPPGPGAVAVRNICLGDAAPAAGALFHQAAATGPRSDRLVAVPVPRRALLEASTLGDRLGPGLRAAQSIGLRYLASSARYASDGLGVPLGLDDLLAAIGIERTGTVPFPSFYADWSSR